MWEVDPETRRKLVEIQKKPGNNICQDCGSPSPQWASPKFGIFICLTCAGVHRGMGVHISFVRSITMDQFKMNEIARMDKGGNQALKDYWAACPEFSESMSIPDRYSAPFSEDYKEKLSALVEGKEWTGPAPRTAASTAPRRTGTGTPRGMGSGTPRDSSPALSGGARTQKERNEDFFAKKGSENLNRRDDVPPSQGGKYAGFGSAPLDEGTSVGGGGGIAGWDDVTKDPVAALSKGWGFFASTVAKGAKTVNEVVVKPTAQLIAESDLPNNITRTATTLGTTVASSAKVGADSLNRFIDQQQRGTYSNPHAQPERQDFWDSFGDEEWDKSPTGINGGGGAGSKSSAIGTSGIKKKSNMTGFSGGAAASNSGGSGGGKKVDEDWENEKW